MTENYKFSHDYELIRPQMQLSYPITTTEWVQLKKKILAIKDNTNLWQTIGSILIGVSLTTLIATLINDFRTEKTIWICWSAFFITLNCGSLLIYFGRSQIVSQNKKKEELIDHMNTIESRFDSIIDSLTNKVIWSKIVGDHLIILYLS